MKTIIVTLQAMESSKVDDDMDDEATDDSKWEDALKPSKDEEGMALPAHVSNSPMFKGVRKNKETGEVEVTIKLGSR